MIVNNQNLVFSIITAGDQEAVRSSSEPCSLSSLFITVLFGKVKLNSDFQITLVDLSPRTGPRTVGSTHLDGWAESDRPIMNSG